MQIRPELLHTDREFEQLKEVLFEQILAELLHTDPKFEQIQANLSAHVNKALNL